MCIDTTDQRFYTKHTHELRDLCITHYQYFTNSVCMYISDLENLSICSTADLFDNLKLSLGILPLYHWQYVRRSHPLSHTHTERESSRDRGRGCVCGSRELIPDLVKVSLWIF